MKCNNRSSSSRSSSKNRHLSALFLGRPPFYQTAPIVCSSQKASQAVFFVTLIKQGLARAAALT